MSEPGKASPESTINAVSSVPGGISLFLVDRDGAVQSSYFDPRMPNAKWSEWFRLSELAKASPGSTVTAVSSVPGGISLFLADRDGAVQSSYFDPRFID